jgi:hypothetical protein
MDRVRIITGPDQTESAIVLTAAELHPDYLVLNYISQVDQGELQEGFVAGKPKRFDVTDDLGTTYEWIGGSGSGEGELLRRMEIKFQPAVPRGAKFLKVTTGLSVVVFQL